MTSTLEPVLPAALADHTPALWAVEEVLGDEDVEEGDDPAAASAPPPGLPNVWSGPQRDNIVKHLFNRLDGDKVYLFNYSQHDAWAVFAPYKKQAQKTEGSIGATLNASPIGGGLGFTATGKWEYVDLMTSYQSLAAAPQGSQPVELSVQLPEGCDRTHVTIYRADDAKRVWVKNAILKGGHWGCIHADPILLV